MADLNPTEASVAFVSGEKMTLLFGEDITQGMPVYKDTSDNGYLKKCADTSQAAAKVFGASLSAASTGQFGVVQTSGIIDIAATLTIGVMYCVSASGLLCPMTDLAAGDWVAYFGYAVTTARIQLTLDVTGVQHG